MDVAFIRFCRNHCASALWQDGEFCDWQGLPVEVFLVLLDHIGPKEHVALSKTCRAWRNQILKLPRGKMIVEHYASVAKRKQVTAKPVKPVGDQHSVISEIDERVLLSGDEFRASILKIDYGIDGILSVMPSPDISHVEALRLKHLIIPLDDWEYSPLNEHFDEAIDFIMSCKRVLIHCGAGVSRSPTIVILYLMRIGRMSLRQAFDFVFSIRPIIQPNEGFMEQLIAEELRLFGSSSVSLEDFDSESDD